MTITEIAQAAGVSIATVSRYLNNGPVKKETREKLESVILKLNYVPESMVHQIVNTPLKAIAVLVHSLSNNYAMEFAEVLNYCYTGRETMLYIGCIPDPKIEYRYLMDLVSRGIKGTILLDSSEYKTQSEIYNELGKYMPIVLVHSFPADFPFNTITVNQEIGMKNAMRYLINLGHRNILFVRGTKGFSFDLKEKIWKEELEKAGTPPAPEQIRTISDSDKKTGMETTYQAVSEYLEAGNRPSAIFTCNDIMAMGTLKALREKGLQVPRNISLISHDNTALAACNDITSVDMKIRSVAIAAMDLLDYAIGGNDTAARHISITPELVIRSSVLPLSETHMEKNSPFPDKYRIP
jgi:DNA-binding LacI/PurR family transcriptional regulator